MKTLKALTGVSLPTYFSKEKNERENFWVNAAGLLGYPIIGEKLELVYPTLKPIFKLPMFGCEFGREKYVEETINEKLQTLSDAQIKELHEAGTIIFYVDGAQREFDANLYEVCYKNSTPYISFNKYYKRFYLNGSIMLLCSALIAENKFWDVIIEADIKFITQMNLAHLVGLTNENSKVFDKYLLEYNINPTEREFLLKLFKAVNKSIMALYNLQK